MCGELFSLGNSIYWLKWFRWCRLFLRSIELKNFTKIRSSFAWKFASIIQFYQRIDEMFQLTNERVLMLPAGINDDDRSQHSSQLKSIHIHHVNDPQSQCFTIKNSSSCKLIDWTWQVTNCGLWSFTMDNIIIIHFCNFRMDLPMN